MLYLINPELISIEQNDNGGSRIKTITTKSTKTSKEFFRYLANVNFPLEISEDVYDEDNGVYYVDTPVATISVPNETKGQTIFIDSIKDPKKNGVTTAILAIPFNGKIGQIEKTPDYRILSASIVRSSEGIKMGDVTYNSVLYMVITLNPALYDKNHKYHTDELRFSMTVYNIDDDMEGEVICDTVTYSIVFDAVGAEYYLEYGTNVTVDASELLSKRPTWFIHRFNKKPANDSRKTSKSGDNYNTYKKNDHVNESNKPAKKGGYRSDSKSSKNGGYSNSGYEEYFDDGRPKSKRGKKNNKGYKKNRRSDYDDYE